MPRARRRALGAPTLSSGLALGYLSVIVLVPLAALVAKGAHGGWHHFWQVAWNPEAKAALELTLGLARRGRRDQRRDGDGARVDARARRASRASGS